MSILFVRSDGVTGTSFSFNIGTAGTNRVVVIIASDESGNTLSGVTVDGKACSLVRGITNTQGAGNRQEMWYIDEDGLGSSNGTVTVAIQGGDAGWAFHAHLYTGMSQDGPEGSWFNNTDTNNTSTTVTGVNCPTGGVAIMGASGGNSGRTHSGWTSPLIERQEGPHPSSASMGSASGIETGGATNKSYSVTFSGSHYRTTAIVATWGLPGPVLTSVDPNTFDDDEAGIEAVGTNFGATQGTGYVTLSDNPTFGLGNEIVQTVTSWSDTSIFFTANLGMQSPGLKYVFVTDDNGETSLSAKVQVSRAQAFEISLSDNIAASGENTTAQLTPPAGKTTGDFTAGRIQDDENPADSIDIGADEYTEVEFCMQAIDGAREVQYDFRITCGGAELTTYTVTPQVTITTVVDRNFTSTAAIQTDLEVGFISRGNLVHFLTWNPNFDETTGEDTTPD